MDCIILLHRDNNHPCTIYWSKIHKRRYEMKLKSIEKPKKNAIKGFRVVENECIWMKAGVVNFKLCDNNYNCFHCAFDKGMQKTLNSRKTGGPRQTGCPLVRGLAKQYKGVDRPCRHALTGRSKPPKSAPQIMNVITARMISCWMKWTRPVSARGPIIPSHPDTVWRRLLLSSGARMDSI